MILKIKLWFLGGYYELNVRILSKFMCWNFNSLCEGIWRCGLWEVIRVTLGSSWEWSPRDKINALINRWREMGYLSLPCENKARRWPFVNQEESPHTKKLIILEPWFWNSSFQNCGETNICCLSNPIYGIPSEQPKQRQRSFNFLF